jgi:hypothetical protein
MKWTLALASRGITFGKVVEAARFGRKTGWHRDYLDLSADGQRLNDTEKSQLPAEIMLPDQLIAGLGPSHKSSGGGLCVLKRMKSGQGMKKFGTIFEVLRLLLDTYKPFVLQRMWSKLEVTMVFLGPPVGRSKS